MDRRTLLQLMSAALLAGCTRSDPDGSKLKIVVVGAGVIGASIAYHLSKSGAEVTVIDEAGSATRASQGTFAWINATWAKQPQSYHALNQAGLANWASLQAELNIPVKWGGSLEWFESEERQQRLAEQIDEQIAWGEPAEMLGANRLAQMEPNVDFQGASSAAFSGNDGAVDPVVATLALLRAAKANGASVQHPCKLLGVSTSKGDVNSVETSLGTIPANKVVLATGAAPNAAKEFAGIDLPQRSTPGVIAVTKPMPPLLNRLIIAPGVHMHQRLDARIVLGEQGGAPDNEAHAARLRDRPTAFPTPEMAEQHYARIHAIAERFVPQMERAEADAVYIGWRPLPLDGHPVLGFSPTRRDVYLAVMHSGVSLAPIVGQLAAQEIVSGMQIERLADYRPSRTFTQVKRY